MGNLTEIKHVIMKDLDIIVKEYLKKRHHDTSIFIAEKSGYKYFYTFYKLCSNHKIGLPNIIKIDKNNRIIEVDYLPEIMWAIREIKKLQ